MKKKMILFALCFMCAGLAACGTENTDAGAPQNATAAATESTETATASEETEPAVTEETEAAPTETATAEETTETQAAETEAAQAEETEAATEGESESSTDALTEEQAMEAVKNYLFSVNPDLKKMAESDEYTVYWDSETNDAGEIVVLYRSYTGAQVRYYVDPVSGEAYVTETVPGIIDEEQRTEETLNVRDYLA